jgi:hypothetical protein
MKKVLLIVIDALASRVVFPAMDAGRLPNIKALADAGTIAPDCSAIFPSITQAATSSITTGRYPQAHGIAGSHWYEPDRDHIAYYGADFWVIWEKGIGEFFDGFLNKLNHERLRADTLFQIVERTGKQAASLNYLMFRGDRRHKVNVPLLLGILPGVPFSEEIYGPALFRLGDFVGPDLDGVDLSISTKGPFEKFGFEDKYTAQNLIKLAEQRQLPDFTIAYFPDNDFDSHERGPKQAVTTLEQVDSYLGEFIAAAGGLETLLAECCILLTGDHSQTDMLADASQAGIDLDAILSEFDISKAGTPMTEDDQIVICPDMRIATIYFRQPTTARITRVSTRLLEDPRIDQVLWASEVTGEGGRGYYVTTRDRGGLHFWPGDDGPHTAADAQGGTWSWDGDLRAVDGQVQDGVITFPTYPNAFERIAGTLELEQSGDLWMTAHPGHEFLISGVELHPGGAHGSLHRDDSTVPLLLAGAPEGVTLPAHPRTVDVAPLCLNVLGIEPPYPVGASHGRQE